MDRYLTRSDGTKLGPRRLSRARLSFWRRILAFFPIARLVRKKANWYSIAEVVLP